jgi:hypothetical protein
MRSKTVLLYVLFGLALGLLLFPVMRSIHYRPDEMIASETAITLLRRVVGVVITATAAFALLVRGLAGEPVEGLVRLFLPLLAGLLLVGAHWPEVTLAIVTVLAALARDTYIRRANQTPAEVQPPPQ